MSPPLDLAEVARMRKAAVSNGYRLLRVQSHGKRPTAGNWQDGEPLDALLCVTPDAANTGMTCGGLRVVDIDCDDLVLVNQIVVAAATHLPSGPPVRRRAGSPRLALIYRAAAGEPTKLTIAGNKGKVEILGKGQQLVVEGIHPSGTKLEWLKGRSPSTVPLDQLPIVSEFSIQAFLDACRSIVEAADQVSSAGNFPLWPRVPTAEANELSAGLESAQWFDLLQPEDKARLVSKCLEAIDNTRTDPRDRWLRVLFAVKDASTRGCLGAREFALNWSKRGCRWTSEQDFDGVWDSFRAGAITVGTLLHEGQQAGVDIPLWRAKISPPVGGSQSAVGQNTPAARRTVAVANLPQVPPKRKWLHGTDLARGAVSLLVAPGARGKSTWLLTLALACASGRPLLGSHVFGGPLRVLYLNAEDSTNEIALRLRAAMRHYHLTDSDLAGLRVAGADDFPLTLMLLDRGQPKLSDEGWAALSAELEPVLPDVVLVDPLVALMGGVSLNDNSAAALMLSNFVRLAARKDLALVIAHHAAKNREATSAEAAMGAASLVNLARIVLSIEPLAESDAGKIGLAPWDARSVFRIIGTKQNLSPPNATDRWFRLLSVDMPNAQPPIYPQGDRVAVVEPFTPIPLVPCFPFR